MKILNLDEFLMEEQGVEYKGTVYPLKEVETEEFLLFLEAGKDFDQATSTAEQMRIGLQMLDMVCPDMPMEVRKTMPIRVMTKLLEKVQEIMSGSTDEDAQDPNSEEAPEA